MDPFSAVSLVGTVVQIVDFGIKLCAKSSEIYHSEAGAEVRNLELEQIAQSLVSTNHRLKLRASKACAYAVSDDETELRDLCAQCNSVAHELINGLRGAKIEGPHKRWKSVRQALKQTLGADKVQDLYERLKRYRDQVVVLLLVITNTKQDGLTESLNDLNQAVHRSEAKLVDESQKSRDQILTAIKTSQYSPSSPRDVSIVSDLLLDMMTQTAARSSKDNVLNSLYYPRMSDRREWISRAHRKTFNWALEGKSAELGATPWANLQQWLMNGDGIYWLAGKAGSGKSTLMKYIDQDDRTAQLLQRWAAPLPLAVASFYFWNPGTTMQKSQLGLLQSLLYEVLSQRPELISRVLPKRWDPSSPHGSSTYSWTISELLDAFKLLSEIELRTRFCFIIDGLDEFDGDHQQLVEMLIRLTWSSNVKVLASSRPWLVFNDAFEKNPKLMLQDLTHNDIKVFTHDSLYGHGKFSTLLSLEPDRAPQLVDEIVEKASGVFLWVYLVVRSLMEGLTNADRMVDLQRRLQALPADLEQYFLHILTSLDAFYLRQASELFRLALEARKPLSVLTFSFLDEEDPQFALKRKILPMSDEEEMSRCQTIQRRLNSRCKGLLESRRRKACDEYSNSDGVVAEVESYEVDFLHRTVRDFLSTPTVQVQLVASDSANFNANLTLARAFVAQLKALRIASHFESNFQSLWQTVFDAIHHLSKVRDDAGDLTEKFELLEELDRTAGIYRCNAVVKRRCSTDAHWVNTGYRYGFEPLWHCDIVTFAIQYDFIPYVRMRLSSGYQIKKDGKPLLAFAMTAVSTFDDLKYGRHSFTSRGGYSALHFEMLKLLLAHGADPNEKDGEFTIWVRYLMSLWILAADRLKIWTDNVSEWFRITKLLLSHGADCRATCTPPWDYSRPKTFMQKMRSKDDWKIQKPSYTTIEIIRLLFGGDSVVDIAELEDLVDFEQKPQPSQLPTPPTSPHPRNVSGPYLEVPKRQQNHSAHQRSPSASSDVSQESVISWRRPTAQDIVVPRKPIAVGGLHATPEGERQSSKKHAGNSVGNDKSGIASWFRKVARR